MPNRVVSLVLVLVVCAGGVMAQDKTCCPPTDQFTAELIPRNSRIYIAPIDTPNTKRMLSDFESYLAAALRKKNVPLVMVNDRSQADFEIVGTAERKEPGWDMKIFLGEFRDTILASISVVNMKTGVVAYADSSYREAANRGPRSSAEKLAKYLKKKIEDDEKKLQKGK
jgi:hypothetical protein